MYVTGKISSPGTFHYNCNIDDHQADLICSMNGGHFECADKPCGGQKYKCDCFVYRFSFYKTFYTILFHNSRVVFWSNFQKSTQLFADPGFDK